MINTIRRHQQVLMIAVTIVVIITFIWLYNTTQFERIGRDRIGTIYGRAVRMGDFERAARQFQLALELGLFELAQSLGGMDRERAAEDFFLNGAVVTKEAAGMQVRPGEEEVLATIKNLRRFQTNGAFDPAKYAEFVQLALGPRGFTEAQLEEVVRLALQVVAIKGVIGSTIEVSPAEVRKLCTQQFQQQEVAVVRFARDQLAATVEVPEEKVAAAFEQRKGALRSPERRRVQFVAFTLGEEDQKLSGRDRTAALQRTADRAQEFAEALLAAGTTFEGVAGRFAVAVAETGAFTQAEPDPSLAGAKEIAGAAFALPPNQPVSDVLQAGETFYVLRVAEVIPSKPLTLDEARPDLLAQLKKEQTAEKLAAQAAEARTKIEEELKAGKSFADAAAGKGGAFEKLAPFAFADARGDAGPPREVLFKVATMKERQLSEFVPTADGGFLVYLEKRLPLAEETLAKERGRFDMLLGQARRETAFQEWLRLRRQAANIQGFGGPS